MDDSRIAMATVTAHASLHYTHYNINVMYHGIGIQRHIGHIVSRSALP
jgi:hypothetical protein